LIVHPTNAPEAPLAPPIPVYVSKIRAAVCRVSSHVEPARCSRLSALEPCRVDRVDPTLSAGRILITRRPCGFSDLKKGGGGGGPSVRCITRAPFSRVRVTGSGLIGWAEAWSASGIPSPDGATDSAARCRSGSRRLPPDPRLAHEPASPRPRQLVHGLAACRGVEPSFRHTSRRHGRPLAAISGAAPAPACVQAIARPPPKQACPRLPRSASDSASALPRARGGSETGHYGWDIASPFGSRHGGGHALHARTGRSFRLTRRPDHDELVLRVLPLAEVGDRPGQTHPEASLGDDRRDAGRKLFFSSARLFPSSPSVSAPHVIPSPLEALPPPPHRGRPTYDGLRKPAGLEPPRGPGRT